MFASGLAVALGFLKRVPWQLWAVLAVIATGWFYGDYRYAEGRDDEVVRRDRIVAEAVLKAIKSEREAQAAFVGRGDERQAETRDLRKAAAEAPVGSKTQAVLDALGSAGGE